MAFLTDFPLLYPSLGASAFILFYTPMTELASPRNVILSHTTCLLLGLLSLHFLSFFSPEINTLDPMAMSWLRVGAIALAMGLATAIMIAFKFEHPPAAATALIASLGYIVNATQVLGLIAAVFLLVLEAFLLNRIIGGIPYPLWRFNSQAAVDFKELAGIEGKESRVGKQLSSQIFQKR